MALINCPECSKEISDRVESCPNCGYPINEVDSSKGTAQEVEVTGIKFKLSRKYLLIILGSILTLILLLVGIFIFNGLNESNRYNNYIDNLEEAQTLMLDGGAEAEALCNLTYSVWYNTIYEERDYETNEYTINTWGSFNEDFNDSLSNLYSASDTIATIVIIKANQDLVQEKMKDLQNPLDDFRDAYETVSELFEAYNQLTNLAISPSGSLNNYSTKKQDLTDEFMTNYDKLSNQIPNKK